MSGRARSTIAYPYGIPYRYSMTSTITATDARANFYNLISKVNSNHDPVINIHDRLVHEVLESEEIVRVLAMWTHHK